MIIFCIKHRSLQINEYYGNKKKNAHGSSEISVLWKIRTLVVSRIFIVCFFKIDRSRSRFYFPILAHLLNSIKR